MSEVARPWDTCPVCRGTRHRTDYDFSNSRAAGSVPGRIVSCLSCMLQFKIPARPEIPLETYYADASIYQHRDDRAEAEKEFSSILALARSLVRPGAHLLDLGSGPGHFLGAAVRAGYRTTGLELNPELARFAAAASGAEVVTGDAANLGQLLAGRENHFELITLLDVIEHLRDPVRLLREATRFLAPGGVMLIYTPNHNGLIVRVAHAMQTLSIGRLQAPLRGIYDCDHVVFFTPDSLRRAVLSAGLNAGTMKMQRFNPDRRGIARGVTAVALRLIEAASPWIGGEFRMILAVRRD